MQALKKVSVVQASTNTSVLVAGSTLQTTYGLSLSYTIVNTGDDTIGATVYGANSEDLSDKVSVSELEILSGTADSYALSIAPFEYYCVYIVSAAPDTPGEATVHGMVKG